MFAEWKVVDLAPPLPFGLATAKVVFEASRRLIALFGSLREQLHGDRRDRTRNFLQPLGRRHRPPGEMAVDPFHRLRGDKRQSTGEHSVEGDTERIEVTPGVDGAIHASGLFRRHVGERAGNGLGRMWGLTLASEARCDAKAGQPHFAGRLVEQDVGWLDILVDEATLMKFAECEHNGDGETEKAS